MLLTLFHWIRPKSVEKTIKYVATQLADNVVMADGLKSTETGQLSARSNVNIAPCKAAMFGIIVLEMIPSIYRPYT